MSYPFAPTLTLFDTLAARTKREVQLPPKDYAARILGANAPEKSKLGLLFMGRLNDTPSAKGSLRYDANVRCITGVSADYDGERISFDAALAILREAGVWCILYTSPSHRPDRPRWRILAFTSRELPPEEHARLVARLNGLFSGVLAVESFTLSQCYYYGSVNKSPYHRVELVDGTPIDLLDHLDSSAVGKPNGAGPQMPGAAAGPLDQDALAEQIISGEAYHTACVRLVGKWAQAGMPFLDAQQRLEALFDKVFPADRDLLSRALCEDMQPLNHPAGQRFVDAQIALIGGIDLLILDNIQSLLVGDMKDELSWQQTLPWVRSLTNRHIGQVWVHHTGHDESRSYGTKTREWQLDTVMLLLREEPGQADIRFRLDFTKARERTPTNRDDFGSRLITLSGNEWSSEPGESGGRGGSRRSAKDRAFELLLDALVRYGEFPPREGDLPPVGFTCVTEQAWRQRCAEGNISEATPEAERKAFYRASQALINEGRVGKHGQWIWVVR